MAAPTTQLYRPASGGGTISSDQLVPLLNNSATKYGVPLSILTGVVGMETNFGKNVTTSSAGAVGLMQFLPSTARQYNYPLTNTPTVQQAQQQFDAAAHYLSDLYRQYGSWQAAIQHYSGGGYGLAQVQQKSGQTVPAGEAVSAGINLPSAITDPLSGLANIAELLTSSSFWIRLGEALAGIILLAMGLRSLTGSSTTPATVARGAVKVAKHV